MPEGFTRGEHKAMRGSDRFSVDGRWVAPNAPKPFNVINPATEEVAGTISLGNEVDVDAAVKAARAAFRSYSRTARKERIELFGSIISTCRPCRKELAQAITEEMGAPSQVAEGLHAVTGQIHLKTALDVLREYSFEKKEGGTWIVHEPIGVCALITTGRSTRSPPRSRRRWPAAARWCSSPADTRRSPH